MPFDISIPIGGFVSAKPWMAVNPSASGTPWPGIGRTTNGCLVLAAIAASVASCRESWRYPSPSAISRPLLDQQQSKAARVLADLVFFVSGAD